MIKRFIHALLLLIIFTTQILGQQITVETDGGYTRFNQSYEQSKIVFNNGQMEFHVAGEVINTFKIKDILRIFFYTDGTSIDQQTSSQAIIYSSSTDELIINAHPGCITNIYHTNGECVLSHMQTIANQRISLSSLPSATYVVTTGSKTTKIVKQ